jgi:hypothetical protein
VDVGGGGDELFQHKVEADAIIRWLKERKGLIFYEIDLNEIEVSLFNNSSKTSKA